MISLNFKEKFVVKYTKLLAWQKKFSADINELGRPGYIRMA